MIVAIILNLLNFNFILNDYFNNFIENFDIDFINFRVIIIAFIIKSIILLLNY
jgi:hypothetical protein